MKHLRPAFVIVLMFIALTLFGCAPQPVTAPIPEDALPEERFFGYNTPTCGVFRVVTVAALSDPRLDGSDAVWVSPVEYGDYWMLTDDITYPDIRLTGDLAAEIRNAEPSSPRFAWIQADRDKTKGISAYVIRLLNETEEAEYKKVLAESKSDYPLACP